MKIKLSLYKKLLASFMLVLIPALVAVAIGIWGLNSTSDQIQFMDNRTTVAELGLGMRTQIAQAREACNAVEITGALNRLAEIHAFMDSVKEKAAMVISIGTTDEEKQNAETMESLSDTWLSSIDSLFLEIKLEMSRRGVTSAKVLDEPKINEIYWEEVMTGRKMMAIAVKLPVTPEARVRNRDAQLSYLYPMQKLRPPWLCCCLSLLA